MNLEQIRNQILIQNNFVPNSTTYFGFLNDKINFAYKELFTCMPWSFNQKTANMVVVPDVSAATLDKMWKAIGNTSDFDAEIVADPANPNVYLTSVNTASPIGSGLFKYFWGQQLELDGFDYNIISGYDYDPVAANDHGAIGPNYIGSSTTLTNFRFKKNYYFLPPDCVEVMDIAFRDDRTGRGTIPSKMISIARRLDTDFGLSYQSTADVPSVYINQGETEALPTPTVALTGSEAPCLAANALPLGTYKIAYTYSVGAAGWTTQGSGVSYAQPESAMSPFVEIQVTQADHYIVVDLPDWIPYGAYINFYLAIENTGIDNRYFYIPFGGQPAKPPNPPNRLEGIISQQDPDNSMQYILEANNLPRAPYQTRFSDTNGRLKKIRFYPRPTGGTDVYGYLGPNGGDAKQRKWFQVRYIYKPHDLQFDTDVPEFPEEFHYLLIDRVLVDIFLREGKLNESQIHQKKYDDRLKLLRARYGTEKDTLAVRRAAWQRTGYDPYLIYPNAAQYRPNNGN